MGTETFVSEHPFADEQPAQKAAAPKRAVDLPLLVAIITLVVFGLIMMFSASWDYSLREYGSPLYVRTPTDVACHRNHRNVFAFPFRLSSLTQTGSSFDGFDHHFVDHRIGCQRSPAGCVAIVISSLFQPSELAKVVTILYLSVWLYAKRQFIHDITFGLLPLSVILGLIGGLIYSQPT